MRVTSVVTKRGDSGQTLLSCNLVSKDHPAIDLLGDLDELNCLLGNIEWQQPIQDNIFAISAAIYKGEDWEHIENNTNALEFAIDYINTKLPPLQEFIRPSGNIHLARAVCRRCERKAWTLDKTKKYCIYLNRLSDYLFVLARSTTNGETLWER